MLCAFSGQAENNYRIYIDILRLGEYRFNYPGGMKLQNPTILEIGDVVQIAPECSNPMFGCCFLTVTEIKSWGVQGYVQGLGEDGKIGGQAYMRLKWEEFEYAGKSVWTTGLEVPA